MRTISRMSAVEARLRLGRKMAAFLKREPKFTAGLDALENGQTRVMLLQSVTEALVAVAAEKKSK